MNRNQQPAIFLDRDGVLNQANVREGKPYAPKTLEEFHIFPEAREATKAFKEAGFLVVVVTNQPDVGNGFVEQYVVDSMHKKLAKSVLLDAIKVCYHTQGAGCLCRKPKPGMLIEASLDFGINLTKSFMIGDRFGDMQAGKLAGCRTVFIDYGYAETAMESNQESCVDVVVNTLLEAVNVILKKL